MCAWSFQHLSGHEKTKLDQLRMLTNGGGVHVPCLVADRKGFRIVGTLSLVGCRECLKSESER